MPAIKRARSLVDEQAPYLGVVQDIDQLFGETGGR